MHFRTIFLLFILCDVVLHVFVNTGFIDDTWFDGRD